jgi:branched-chain amino acid transport system substrate-binding protein
MRRYILPAVALAAMALCPPLWATAASGATAEPIRVGTMAPLSGLFAQPGKDIVDGFRMYFEQTGFQAGGRKIELIEEDDEGNNATAVTKYRKLVERDRIHVFGGVVLVNIGYALAPMFDKDRVPALFVTSPDDLTKRRRARWMIRAAMSASQPMHAMGDYAYKVLGYRKVAAVAIDNGFGHESVAGFQRVFEDLGGRMVQKLWAPLNAVDYAPYITQLQRDVDAVVAANAGATAVRFFKQYAEYGLKGKIPLIGTGVTSEDTVIRGLTDEAEGYVGALHYASTLPSPANQAFVKAVVAKFGRTPRSRSTTTATPRTTSIS